MQHCSGGKVYSAELYKTVGQNFMFC